MRDYTYICRHPNYQALCHTHSSQTTTIITNNNNNYQHQFWQQIVKQMEPPAVVRQFTECVKYNN